MTIQIEENTVYKKVSTLLKESINKIAFEKDKVILGLPGGRSITPVLNYLKKEKVDWNKIHVFMVDERLVPIDDDQSNYRLIK